LRAVSRVDKTVAMRAVVIAVANSLALICRSRAALQIEILALRHQLAVYQRGGHRPNCALPTGSSGHGCLESGRGGERPW